MVRPFAPLDRALSRIGSGATLALGLAFGATAGLLSISSSAIPASIGIAGFLLAAILFVRGFFVWIRTAVRSGDGIFFNYRIDRVLAQFWACPPMLLGWGMVAGMLIGGLIGEQLVPR